MVTKLTKNPYIESLEDKTYMLPCCLATILGIDEKTLELLRKNKKSPAYRRNFDFKEQNNNCIKYFIHGENGVLDYIAKNKVFDINKTMHRCLDEDRVISNEIFKITQGSVNEIVELFTGNRLSSLKNKSLRPKQLADILNTSTARLEKLRKEGKTPAYIKSDKDGYIKYPLVGENSVVCYVDNFTNGAISRALSIKIINI